MCHKIACKLFPVSTGWTTFITDEITLRAVASLRTRDLLKMPLKQNTRVSKTKQGHLSSAVWSWCLIATQFSECLWAKTSVEFKHFKGPSDLCECLASAYCVQTAGLASPYCVQTAGLASAYCVQTADLASPYCVQAASLASPYYVQTKALIGRTPVGLQAVELYKRRYTHSNVRNNKSGVGLGQFSCAWWVTHTAQWGLYACALHLSR